MTALPYVEVPARAGQRADSLVVMLPGAYHSPQDMLAQGFASAVQQRGLALDLRLVELSFAQIAGSDALHLLHDSLLQPARQAGYRRLWLAGISIGGYVSMACAQRYPGLLDGVLLLAPYPGNRMTTGEIRLAGGLQAWQPDTPPAADSELAGWYWLKHHATGTTQAHLGYGREDRFAPGHQLMAAALPAAHVDCIDGGHDWPIWLALWQRFLARDALGLQEVHA